MVGWQQTVNWVGGGTKCLQPDVFWEAVNVVPVNTGWSKSRAVQSLLFSTMEVISVLKLNWWLNMLVWLQKLCSCEHRLRDVTSFLQWLWNHTSTDMASSVALFAIVVEHDLQTQSYLKCQEGFRSAFLEVSSAKQVNSVLFNIEF